jgi:hypothetical protein
LRVHAALDLESSCGEVRCVGLAIRTRITGSGGSVGVASFVLWVVRAVGDSEAHTSRLTSKDRLICTIFLKKQSMKIDVKGKKR